MKTVLLLATILAPLCGCTLTPEQETWNRQHHVGEIPLTPQSGPSSPFNDKNYADPHPHSDSDDAQRAAYQQHQQEQEDSRPGVTEPDLSKMTCTGSSNSSTGPNSGSLTSSTSCHN